MKKDRIYDLIGAEIVAVEEVADGLFVFNLAADSADATLVFDPKQLKFVADHGPKGEPHGSPPCAKAGASPSAFDLLEAMRPLWDHLPAAVKATTEGQIVRRALAVSPPADEISTTHRGATQLRPPAPADDSKFPEGDPAEVHPADSLAESQSGLNGPSGSPTSPSGRVSPPAEQAKP